MPDTKARKLVKQLGVSLLVGLMVAGVVYLVGQPRRPQSAPETVAVATRTIKPGEYIKPEDLETVLVPQGSRHPLAVSAAGDIVNKQVKEPVYEGEQVLSSRLVGPNEEELPFALLPGMQAVTIGVDEVGGVAGLIRPGFQVDVVARTSGRSSITSQIIVRRAKVLAVNQIRPTAKTEPADQARFAQQVTLEVDSATADIVARLVGTVSYHIVVSAADEWPNDLPTPASKAVTLWRGTTAEQLVVPVR